MKSFLNFIVNIKVLKPDTMQNYTPNLQKSFLEIFLIPLF